MGRRFTFDQVGQEQDRADESFLVSGERWRESVGISRQTLNRWIGLFNFRPVYLHGRMFLSRKEIRAWEKRVLAGEFGSKPVMPSPHKNQKPTEKEEVTA